MIKADDFENNVKIAVLGNGNVGKSSIIKRFCRNNFETIYDKTIGIQYMERTITLPQTSQQVCLMVWDCAGQEDFDIVTSEYYSKGGGVDGVIFVFAGNDKNSFEMVKQWKQKFEKYSTSYNNKNPVMVLVQNKIDLPATVEARDAENLSRELKIRFYRVSAKDNIMIDQAFEYVAQECLKRHANTSSTSSSNNMQKTVELFQQQQLQQQPVPTTMHNKHQSGGNNCSIS